MLRILPLLLVFTLVTTTSFAQSLSWKKHKKAAEQSYKLGKYQEAAEQFELAWKKNPDQTNLIVQAGECYSLLKDFKKAIAAYQQAKGQFSTSDLAGLQYARALKQDGQYEAAKKAFVDFSSSYEGESQAVVNQIVGTEIRGCDLGMRLINETVNSKWQVSHLGEKINSPYTDIAPIAFAEDLLYFSSTRKNNKAFLYRSQKQRGNWSKAIAATKLPNLPDRHLANGTFTPDSKRFYFTLCDATTTDKTGLTSVCEIFVIKRVGSSWSTPIRMRNYINEVGSTTTQPYVIHKDGQEILYFASNRKGGKGGMDIWMTVREIDSGDIDFTYPVNLGKQINSIGDEITPFYDEKEGTLYFSSNGLVSMGGWDIFKAKGSGQKWEQPENLGMPINSSADDFYFVLKPSRKGGFLVSNRIVGAEKLSTQHEDIFEFGIDRKETNLMISGMIVEKNSTTDIQNALVSLYEITNNQERLLTRKKVNANTYSLPILPHKNYRLTIEKNGFLRDVFDFNTTQNEQSIAHNFYLIKENTTPPIAETKTKPTTSPTQNTYDPPTTTNTSPPKVVRTNTTSTTKPTTSRPNINTSPTYTNTTPQPSVNTSIGTYYKVQLIAINYYNPQHARYRQVKNLATIEAEAIPNKPGIVRVLMSSFSTKQEAQRMMQRARESGFADAFVVKYRNGERLGMVYR